MHNCFEVDLYMNWHWKNIFDRLLSCKKQICLMVWFNWCTIKSLCCLIKVYTAILISSLAGLRSHKAVLSTSKELSLVRCFFVCFFGKFQNSLALFLLSLFSSWLVQVAGCKPMKCEWTQCMSGVCKFKLEKNLRWILIL